MPTPERWRAIDGYEGLYEISDHGRVRSLPRLVERICKHDVYVSERPGKIFSRKRLKRGYPGALLTDEMGMKTRYQIHRLVAKAFLPSPKPHQVNVLHKDDDKNNAYYKNLKWGTQKENLKDMSARGRNQYTTYPGESNYNAKLTDKQIQQIRKLSASRVLTQSELAVKFGVSVSTIDRISNNRAWTHLQGVNK